MPLLACACRVLPSPPAVAVKISLIFDTSVGDDPRITQRSHPSSTTPHTPLSRSPPLERGWRLSPPMAGGRSSISAGHGGRARMIINRRGGYEQTSHPVLRTTTSACHRPPATQPIHRPAFSIFLWPRPEDPFKLPSS